MSWTAVPAKFAWTLFGSLAMNAFFLGAAVVHWNHEHEPSVQAADPATGNQVNDDSDAPTPPADTRGRDPGNGSTAMGAPELPLFRDLVRTMGGPADPRVRQAIKEHRPQIRAMKQEIAEARQAVRAAFQAEDFDPAALQVALDELQAATQKAQDRAQEGVIDLASQLSAGERQQLRRFHKRRMGDGRGSHGPPFTPPGQRRSPHGSPPGPPR